MDINEAYVPNQEPTYNQGQATSSRMGRFDVWLDEQTGEESKRPILQ